MRSKLIIAALVISIAVVAGIGFYMVTEEIQPDYLNFLPDQPYAQLEMQRPGRLPESLRTTKFFQVLESSGLADDFQERIIAELLSETGLPPISVSDYLSDLETDFITGSVIAVVGTEQNPFQIISVMALDTEKITSEELKKLLADNEILADENFIKEHYSHRGYEVMVFNAPGHDEHFPTEIAVVDDFVVVGMGEEAVVDAIDRAHTPEATSSLFNRETNDFKMAGQINPGLVKAFVLRLEDEFQKQDILTEEKFSFSGMKEFLAKFGSGMESLSGKLMFENGEVKITSNLEMKPEKLHPWFDLFLDIDPQTIDGAQYFPTNAANFSASVLPELDKMFSTVLDLVVEMVEDCAGTEVRGQAKMFAGMMRAFVPEGDIKNLLSLLGPRLAFGSYFTGAEENWLVILDLEDYDEFQSAVQFINQYDYLNFSADEKSFTLGKGDREVQIFFETDNDNLIFAVDPEPLARARRRASNSDNLAAHEEFADLRAKFPARVNDMSYYNLAPFSALVESLAAESVDHELAALFLKKDNVSILEDFLNKLPPAFSVTVNDPRRGRVETSFTGPGGTLLTLFSIRALEGSVVDIDSVVVE